MSVPGLYIRRGRSWLVALVFLLFAALMVAFVPEHARNASATDSLAAGFDSTRVVELQEEFEDDGTSTALVLYTSDSGTLTEDQIDAARVAIFDQLGIPAEAIAAMEAGGMPEGAGAGQLPPEAQAAIDSGESQIPPEALAAIEAGEGLPPFPIVSEDGTAAFGVIPVDAITAGENSEFIEGLRTTLADSAPDGVTVQVTGAAAIRADLGAVFQGANFRLLAVTASIVALLLLVTYRSPLLWIVPLTVVGLADRLAAVVATHVLATFGVPWDDSTIGILSVLVFGAGTNYALLLIARYRDELRAVEDRYVAMRSAIRHAGEAIIVSASTVVLGLLTLLLSVFPATRGLGLASAVGIVVAAGYALVVLPAVLVLFPRGIFWPLVPRVGQASAADGTKSVWARVGRAVDRRPAAFIVGTLLLLGVMSVGNLRVETGLSQSEQFLQKPQAITALERLGESFPAGASDPAVVITESGGEQVAATALGVAGVSSATVTDTAGELTAVDVVIDAEPGSDEAADVIRELRAALEGTASWVGGTEAQALDTLEGAQQDQRTVIPLIVALVLGILVVLLRSIVAPIILVATVVATWFAALGASWWVFVEVLGFQALDATVPLLTFLFLVALGVDYNIFLVTRAGEEAKRHGTRRGMLRALTSTGGVITSAGILLAAVFATLGVLPLVVLGQIGVIICVGVLLDTLVVRTVLVPAIAIVLGDRFWWPRRIRREQPAPPTEPSPSTPEEVPALVG